MQLLKALEEKFNTRFLVYITGDRLGLETQIAGDNVPMFHEHLSRMGKQKSISLFLYSTGGLTIAGFALVNLIREFCDEFRAVVPFRALSTATLMCLGANEIVMTPMGQLGPIDPSVTHPLGPMIQTPQGQLTIPVNVEDVNGYIDLAKKEFGLVSEESMAKVFDLLSSRVSPVVLGAVQRSREQIAFLASVLMKHHCDNGEVIEKIIGVLTRERFSHDYIIGRQEAKSLGLNIAEADSGILDLVLSLFNEYKDMLELTSPLNKEALLAGQPQGIFKFVRAIVESVDLSHIFSTSIQIDKVQIQPPGQPMPMPHYQDTLLGEGWFNEQVR